MEELKFEECELDELNEHNNGGIILLIKLGKYDYTYGRLLFGDEIGNKKITKDYLSSVFDRMKYNILYRIFDMPNENNNNIVDAA